jgi:hypothetical protein
LLTGGRCSEVVVKAGLTVLTFLPIYSYFDILTVISWMSLFIFLFRSHFRFTRSFFLFIFLLFLWQVYHFPIHRISIFYQNFQSLT